jgi:hypothetical protein
VAVGTSGFAQFRLSGRRNLRSDCPCHFAARWLFVPSGRLLFFGTQVAYSQSSLESDVDNARIIEMTHKGLGDDVIIARIKASATKFEPFG